MSLILTQARKKRSNDTINQSNQNTVTSISGITTNPEHFHQIRLAIEANDFESFKRLLNTTAVAVNDLDEIGGPSLLMIAAECGSIRIVKELIARGADQDYQDTDNWTALLCAVKECKTETAIELIESGCNIHLMDMGGWTALMWASYKGQAEVSEILLKRGAECNFFDNDNHMTCLCWASGRGYRLVAELLLRHGAKVDVGDKYGTTPLIWAARKGHVDVVRLLLKYGANVDAIGMFGWSALVVATRGNFTSVVEILLSYKPNVNICDPQGLTPLMTASKEGNLDIVNLLLNAHAYVNMSDKNGDSALIHAAKSGHVSIVEALIKAHADIDHHGVDRKTALYCAVEKGHELVVKSLLKSNPNLEIATRDCGDTALLRSVRSRKINIVKMLLDKKAKVSQVDKDGDTVLHIAARSQSKAILELLLRNPSNSQLLYKPNKRGETPFSIDSSHQKPVLSSLFGAAPSSRRVLEKETQLGYDLYSSAIANLLSEPQLKTPICIGLFAKWGSGKSFLIGKLKDDLMNFTSSWGSFSAADAHSRGFGWTSILTVITLSILVGTSVLIASNGQFLAAFIALIFCLIACYTFIGIFTYCGHRWSSNASLQQSLAKARLTLLICFANPPKSTPETVSSQPVRFLFSDSPGVKVGSFNEGSVSQFMSAVLDSLWEVMELEFGFLPVRLYRVFRPKHCSDVNKWRWRRVCLMLPTLGLLMFFLLSCSGLLVLYYFSLNHNSLLVPTESSVNGTTTDVSIDQPSDDPMSSITVYVLVVLVSVIATWIVANIRIPFKIMKELFFPRRKKLDGPSIQKEVGLVSSCLFCFDAFEGRRQSRIVLVLDALESVYESERLVSFLEAVNVHIANPNAVAHSALSDPFVLILALDPHHHATSRSKEYLKTMVHLPFYLQNSQLRRVRISQTTADRIRDIRSGSMVSIADAAAASTSLTRSTSKLSTSAVKAGRSGQKSLLKPAESVASLMGGGGGTSGEAPTKVLLTDDYFSDVNPKSLRRIMNIVYVEGRLLKAFNIDFSWHRLTIWVNITEQFPLRSSALIVFCELMESKFNDDGISLKTMYDRVAPYISGDSFHNEHPGYKKEDTDEKKLLLFLSSTSSAAGLTLADLKIFSPFTINVDPNYRRILQEFLSKNPNIAAVSNRTGSVSINIDPVVQQGATTPATRILRISDLTIDGVILMLRAIDGFNISMIDSYAEQVRKNNVNGKVLSAIGTENESELNELKQVLGFSFGDWLLFKRVILSGKVPMEKPPLTLAPSHAQSQNQLKESPSAIVVSPTPSNVVQHESNPLTTAMSASTGDTRVSGVSPPPSHTSQHLDVQSRLLEKQVTLEEAALASAIVVDSPSTDTGSISSSSADGKGMIERRHSEVVGINRHADEDEIGVLYINQNQMRTSTQSVVSFNESPTKERKPMPSPIDFLKSRQDLELGTPNERTPLVSPSQHSIASSASTSSSSSSARKKPLVRQSAGHIDAKNETVL